MIGSLLYRETLKNRQNYSKDKNDELAFSLNRKWRPPIGQLNMGNKFKLKVMLD